MGVLLWNMTPDWPEFERAAKKVDDLGYEHLWTWDHLHAIFGEPQQPIFEGWMSLGAWAKATTRVRLGLLVGANTFRNPGLVAKLATTLDHISDGRAIMGLGGAWFEYEHDRHGIDFGHSAGERLDWMDEAAAAIRTLLDGGEVTSEPDGRYSFDHLRQEPLPIQQHVPLMIGGSGERKTLRTIAKYADMWNMAWAPGADDAQDGGARSALRRRRSRPSCDRTHGFAASSSCATARPRRTGSGWKRWR